MFKSSPHERLTSLLSNYLEFDPEQLKVGIWSGDLQIGGRASAKVSGDSGSNFNKNDNDASSDGGVNLRPEALSPLLSPLNLCLKAGSRIRHLRVKIPWKHLIDGSSRVDVHVSGLTLVVGVQARPFHDPPCSSSDTSASPTNTSQSAATSAQDWINNNKQNLEEALNELLKGQEDRDQHESPMTLLEREVKQNLIAQAEKHLYSSRDPSALQQVIDEHKLKSKKQKVKRSLIRSWLDATTSSLVWTLLGSVHVKLEDVRIIMAQDHMQVGVSIDCFEVAKGDIAKHHRAPNTKPAETGLNGAATTSFDINSHLATAHAPILQEELHASGKNISERHHVPMSEVFRQSSMQSSINGDRSTTSALIYETLVGGTDGAKQQQPVHGGDTHAKRKDDVSGSATATKTNSIEKLIQVRGIGLFISDTRSSADRNNTVTGPSLLERRRGSFVDTSSYPLIWDPTVAFAESDTNGLLQENELIIPLKDDFVLRQPESQLSLQVVVPETPTANTSQRNSDATAAQNGERNLSNNKSKSTTRVDLSVTMGGIEGSFHRRQYQLLYDFLSSTEKVKNGRPDIPVLGDNRDPAHLTTREPFAHTLAYLPRRSIRVWWQYAYRCVIRDIHLGNTKYIRGSNKPKKDRAETKVRVVYMDLFSSIHLLRHWQGPKLQKAEESLERLEDRLSVEKIIIYRALVRHRASRKQGVSGRRRSLHTHGHYEPYIQISSRRFSGTVATQQTRSNKKLSNEQHFDMFATQLAQQIESLDRRLRLSPDDRLFDCDQTCITFSCSVVLPTLQLKLVLGESLPTMSPAMLSLTMRNVTLFLDGDSERHQKAQFSIEWCRVEGPQNQPILIAMEDIRYDEAAAGRRQGHNSSESESFSSRSPSVVLPPLDQEPLFSGMLALKSAGEESDPSETGGFCQTSPGRVALIANLGRLFATLDIDVAEEILRFFEPEVGSSRPQTGFSRTNHGEARNLARRGAAMRCLSSSAEQLHVNERREDVEFVFQGLDIAVPIKTERSGSIPTPRCLQLSCGWAELRSGRFLQRNNAFKHWDWHNDEADLSYLEPLYRSHSGDTTDKIGDNEGNDRVQHNVQAGIKKRPVEDTQTIKDITSKYHDSVFSHYVSLSLWR
jgi:hypothetical protein